MSLEKLDHLGGMAHSEVFDGLVRFNTNSVSECFIPTYLASTFCE
jgi:hypothetical protein